MDDVADADTSAQDSPSTLSSPASRVDFNDATALDTPSAENRNAASSASNSGNTSPLASEHSTNDNDTEPSSARDLANHTPHSTAAPHDAVSLEAITPDDHNDSYDAADESNAKPQPRLPSFEQVGFSAAVPHSLSNQQDATSPSRTSTADRNGTATSTPQTPPSKRATSSTLQQTPTRSSTSSAIHGSADGDPILLKKSPLRNQQDQQLPGASSVTSAAGANSASGRASTTSGGRPSLAGGKVILHVLLVSFHHRNGPQVEYCYPPLPTPKVVSTLSSGDSQVEIPLEWNFLPFMCLPDGAHSLEEDYTYFHLPPSKSLGSPYDHTIFGMSCYRQIKADSLINKSSDITRTMVQKAVVVLATEPVLPSFRQKVGLVTQALFEQRDFSQLDILETLYGSLSSLVTVGCISDARLNMGLSIRDLVNTFKSRTLILVKAMLCECRILFFGKTVEKVSSLQYALCSLFPDLLRNLRNCGTPELSADTGFGGVLRAPDSNAETFERIVRNKQFGLPLVFFGKGSFFQPYIPLQQLDVVLAPSTRAFLVGTTNSLFTTHSLVNLDVVANVDTGQLEIKSSIRHDIGLTPPDRKFIEMIVMIISRTEENIESGTFIDFEGSDDDIRLRFTEYIEALIATTQKDNIECKDRVSALMGDPSSVPLTLDPNKRPSFTCEKNLPAPPPVALSNSTATQSSAGSVTQQSVATSPAIDPRSGNQSDLIMVNEDDDTATTNSNPSIFSIFKKGPASAGDALNEFGPQFVRHWRSSENYFVWTSASMPDGLYELCEPHHPCRGVNVFDAYHSTFTNTVTDLSVKFNKGPQSGPQRHDLNAFKTGPESSNTNGGKVAEQTAQQSQKNDQQSQNTQQNEQKREEKTPQDTPEQGNSLGNTATQLFASWGSWYTQKKREWSSDQDKQQQEKQQDK